MALQTKALRSGRDTPATNEWLLPTACIFSGGAALVFENLCFRAAGLALGNSVLSAAVVTAAFMAGLGLGNLIAATTHLRIRDAIRTYVWVETGIAVFGLVCFLLLFRGQSELSAMLAPWHDRGVVLQVLRFAVALLVLLVPATGIGLTLPLLIGVETRQWTSFGSRLAWLYACNTLGAVIGSLVAEFVLIGSLGLIGTAVFASGCNLVAAMLVRGLKRGGDGAAPTTAAAGRLDRDPGSNDASPMRIRTLLTAAMLSGFNLLALEILWFRFLQLFFNGTTKTFAIMLATVLLGLSLGGALAARLCRHGSRPRLIRAAYLASGFYLVFSYATLANLQSLFTFPGDVRFRTITLTCAFLTGPICVLSGALFGLIGQSLHELVGKPIRSTGLLTLANTVGATAGPLAGAFLLLPVFRLEMGFFIIAVCYGVAAILVREPAAPEARPWVRPALQAACFVGILACFPFGLMQQKFFGRIASRLPEATLLRANEGLSETSFYFRHNAMGQPFYHRLVTHGYSMSASDPRSKRYMKLFAWVPLALHPDARDALLMCFGVGSTASALVDSTGLNRIDVVDVSGDILQSSGLLFPPPARNPLADPRVKTWVEDGRFYLQATRHNYDLITGEPPPPKIAGVVNLYTEEFFRLVRHRLNEGGFFSYWLPVYQMQPQEMRSIVRAFLNVFPEGTLWDGGGLNLMLLGRNGAGRPPTASEFARQWGDAKVAAEMSSLGLESPAQLGATFIADAPALGRFCAEARPLTDIFPQRISTDLRDRSPDSPVYRELVDPLPASARFESSAWVAESIPAEIRAATPPCFRVERFINYALYPSYRPKPDAAAVDEIEVLHTTSLRTLPLWIVGSSPQQLTIARRLADRGNSSAEIEFHLGAGFMSERNFPAAIQHMRTAARLGFGDEAHWINRLLNALSDILAAETEVSPTPLVPPRAAGASL